ncbi:hypothetical protein OXPF_30860 [Oxobacter pfennigii]|uniref:Alkaline shock protein 23 n=1 Tax=Oxobacter pfennigii TaxID=36849 RepID=A0A0P9AEA8_9CLOT|nr:Asp23/Gls24 family envelope stress response protein [Oxobacter pfennigii]KPU43644.1 hypothetical protein OXPF_30860 [Oxobacter pfennigii]
MKVYGLIGRSGSGKSHRAQQVSKEYNIEYIIDDGLLINGNKVIAGKSAKKESTKLGAVKRAVFNDKEHMEIMKKALLEYSPEKVLILGTSDSMVERIAQKLGLPEITQKIYIEDIATQREIDIATRIRKEQGKHVIPVPTFAIKKDFSGYFIDSIKGLTKKDRETSDDMEKTVVRPTFSYLGKYTIANSVIKSMVSCGAMKIPGVHKVLKVTVENTNDELIISMDISIDYGTILPQIAARVKESVKNDIEYMTAFNISEINIYIKSINIETT